MSGTVTRVIDGDTIEVQLGLGADQGPPEFDRYA